MVRIKNALTSYFVGAITPGQVITPDDVNLELGNFITSVTDDSNETVNEEAFYSGDGTLTRDIVQVQKVYTFTGMFDAEDPGMAFIANLEFAIGDARKVAFKQVRTDGSILYGRGTVTDIKVTGGPAEEYPVFECAISWDSTPTVVPPTP